MALLDDIDDLKEKNKEISERLRTCELNTALNKQAIVNLADNQKVMIEKLDAIRETQLSIDQDVKSTKPLSKKVLAVITAISIGVVTALINITLHYTGVDIAPPAQEEMIQK